MKKCVRININLVLLLILLGCWVNPARSGDVTAEHLIHGNGSSMVTRSYPICFFDRGLSESEKDKIRSNMSSFVAPYMPGGIFSLGFTHNTRWMSLKGKQRGHTALKKVWPRVGCAGDYVSQRQYVLYKRCVSYLRAFLDQRRYEFMGETSEADGISGQLFCDGR